MNRHNRRNRNVIARNRNGKSLPLTTRTTRQPATHKASTRTASPRTASPRRTRRAGKPVKSGRRRGELIDHSRGGNTWLEFPEMKGRVVEKIE